MCPPAYEPTPSSIETRLRFMTITSFEPAGEHIVAPTA
jgi:hypothetical protein